MRTQFYLLLAAVAGLSFIFSSCKPDPKQKPPTVEVTDSIPALSPDNFLHLSDVHLNTTVDAITYGDDTGKNLWEVTKKKLSEVLNGPNPPKFVVYTGDLPAHYDCHKSCFIPESERGDHNNNIRTILTDLRSLVAKNGTPFFYMPGNNDALAGDYYSFADAKKQTPLSLASDPNLPYPALHAASPCGKAPCMVTDPHPTMGYYSARPLPGLRLICLNSIILGRSYSPVDGVSHSSAGNTQMNWFKGQLAQADSAREKVYIAMHIPPGEDAWAVHKKRDTTWMWAHLPSASDSWQNQFLKSIEKHQGSVAGVLYGHTHMDELRRLHAPSNDSVIEIAIAAPGITPYHSNNPGFKQIEYDPQTKEFLDFVTWYTTPDTSEWGKKYYRFSKEFGCEGSSILECLATQTTQEVNSSMDKIYTVKHNGPGYATGPGIEVRVGIE